MNRKHKALLLKFMRGGVRHIPYKVDFDLNSACQIVNSIHPNLYVEQGKLKSGCINPDIDVSIIVPIFNSEAWIDDCILSILNQNTSYNFEAILIDDGSTDGTYNKIAYYESDPRIKIVRQKNRGFSGARNRGIDEAAGKYLMFVDSDDVLERNAVDVLLTAAYRYKVDIVQAGHREFPAIKEVQFPFQYIEPGNVAAKMNGSGYYWDKIYKRSLWDKVRLPQNLLFEDTLLHLVIYPICGSMVTVPDIVYNYRINPKSISHTHKIDSRSIDTYWIVESLLKYRQNLNIEMDSNTYKFLLFQLSAMNFNRLRSYEKQLVKAIFVLSCKLVNDFRIKNANLNYSQSIVEEAFIKHNYYLWRICSMLENHEHRLLEFN